MSERSAVGNGSELAVLLLPVSELDRGDLAQKLESGKCRGFARPGYLGEPPWPEVPEWHQGRAAGAWRARRPLMLGGVTQGTNTSLSKPRCWVVWDR